MSEDPQNIAQRLTDALLSYYDDDDKQLRHIGELDKLLGEIVAAVAVLDARTAHVQQGRGGK